MGGRKINWPKLAQEHGFKEPLDLCVSLYSELKSLHKMSQKLGVSTYSISKILKDTKVLAYKKCIHCGKKFEIDQKRYRQSTCNNPECAKKEEVRKKELKRKLKAKYERIAKEKKQIPKTRINKKRRCKKCGGPMPENYRYYCKDCWSGMPTSGGLDEDPQGIAYI